MTVWNPNAPDVLGPEFFARASAAVVPNSWIGTLQRFRSNSAEAIGNVRLHGSVSTGTAAGVYLVEVLTRAGEIDDGAITTVDYAPNVLAITAGNVNNGAGGGAGTGVVTALDEWPANYTDQVSMGPSASFTLEFASAGFTPTGRIVNVMVELVTPWGTSTWGTSTDAVRRSVLTLVNGGIDYGPITKICPNNNSGGTAGRVLHQWGEINPITGRAWTQQDIRDLDTGTTKVRIARQPGDGGAWAATAVRLIVGYEATERRVAIGVLNTAPMAAGWTADVPLRKPDGTVTWNKANATDYTLSVRAADLRDLFPANPHVLTCSQVAAAADASSPPDLAGLTHSITTAAVWTDNSVTASTIVPIAATPISPATNLAFVLRTTAPATSADSQPYSGVVHVPVSATTGDTEAEFTATATQSYGTLRAVVGWADPTKPPTAPLTVAVRKRIGGATFGSFAVPVSATVADPTLVTVPAVAPIPLTTGDQFFLDFLTDSPNAYTVAFLAVNAAGGGVLYQEGTFGGGVDEASPIDGAASTTLAWTPGDAAAVVDAAVATPANVTAVPGAVALPSQATCSTLQPCTMANVPLVLTSWDPTTLGVDFEQYEVQRIDSIDNVTWQTVAKIPDEALSRFSDTEARIGVLETYRVRVVRADGTASAWSGPVSATAAVSGTGYTFTTNERPSLNVGYPDVHGDIAVRDYRFPDASEVTFARLYGRDLQVAFRSPHDRGVTFVRRLLLAALAAPVEGVGPPAAAALRELSREPLAYVCVRDHDGNRWFGTITVPSMSVQQPHQAHEVELTFTETTRTPTSPTALLEPVVFTGEPLQFIGGDPFLLVGGAPLILV